MVMFSFFVCEIRPLIEMLFRSIVMRMNSDEKYFHKH